MKQATVKKSWSLKKLAILLGMMVLAGNGSFSTVNTTADAFPFSAGNSMKEIPLFISCQNAPRTSHRINPVYLIHYYTAANNQIMSAGIVEIEQMSRFLLMGNPALTPKHAKEVASLYYYESFAEGVNHEIAFSQMCLETGFLKYGGIIKPWQNNFCGLGAINHNYTGESFSSVQDGIRAHIQHLKAYACHKELNKQLIDTRFHHVQRGSAKRVDDLAGKWATDPNYARKIIDIRKRMLQFSFKDVFNIYTPG